MPENEDLYEILQVHPSAHPDVIQAAYRRLALLYHPDRNPSPEAAEMMKRLNLAYETLSDPDRRAAYDRTRSAQQGQRSAPNQRTAYDRRRGAQQGQRSAPNQRGTHDRTGGAQQRQRTETGSRDAYSERPSTSRPTPQSGANTPTTPPEGPRVNKKVVSAVALAVVVAIVVAAVFAAGGGGEGNGDDGGSDGSSRSSVFSPPWSPVPTATLRPTWTPRPLPTSTLSTDESSRSLAVSPTRTPRPTTIPTPIPTSVPTYLVAWNRSATSLPPPTPVPTATLSNDGSSRIVAVSPTRTPRPTATPIRRPTPTPRSTATPTPRPTATLSTDGGSRIVAILPTRTPRPTATLSPTATPLPFPTPIPTAAPPVVEEDYFTRGSSQDEVLHVQGTPTKINSYPGLGEETWTYGRLSQVTFSLPEGRVTAWNNYDGNLKVHLLPKSGTSTTPGYFTRGSSQDDVLHAQGTPTKINSYPGLGEETWTYGRLSQVTFSLPDGRVTAWNNYDGNLKVRLLPKSGTSTTPEYFTRGSSQDDVLHAQGTPTKINSYPGLGEETWTYGRLSQVTFSLPDGRVTEWNNYDGNLKVRLLPKSGNSTTPGYFTRGSSQDDVLHAQGTPTEINSYPGLGEETWTYGRLSQVTFSLPDGRVTEWNNYDGNLKVR